MEKHNSYMIHMNSIEDSDLLIMLEKACLIGMNCISCTFPIIEHNDTADNVLELKEKFNQKTDITPELGKPSNDFTYQRKSGLERLFLIGDFLKDNNNDQLADTFDFKYYLKHKDEHVVASMINLTARFAMDSTEANFQLLSNDLEGNRIIFENTGEPKIELTNNKYHHLHIYGSGTALEDFICELCNKFGIENEHNSLEDVLESIRKDLQLKTYKGQMAKVSLINGVSNAYIDIPLNASFDDGGTKYHSFKDYKEVYRDEYAVSDQASNLLNKLDEIALYGNQYRAEMAISKDIEDRQVLSSLIKDKYGFSSVNILCAYKPGFSWISEAILPKIKDKKVTHIDIYFKPFLKPGETNWHDEDGSTPKRVQEGGRIDKWMELPIRHLQELYPIDEIIKKELGISIDDISFKALDNNADYTYRFTAYHNEECVSDDTYQEQYYERNYLDAYPEAGKVHPFTGYLRIYKDQELIKQVSLPTSSDQVWNDYQTKILPKLKDYIVKHNPKVNRKLQPLFAKIDLDICLDEPSYKLPYHEEMISSLDALQEDIYFVALDYFRYLGKELCGDVFDAPGLIYPRIKKGTATHNIVTLYQNVAEGPCVDLDGSLQPLQSDNNVDLYLKTITYEQKELVYHLATNADTKLIEAYQLISHKNHCDIDNPIISASHFYINETRFDLNPQVPINKHQNIEDINLYEKEVIGLKQYYSVIEQFKGCQRLDVYKIANSYLNNPIYAIELNNQYDGYVSKVKELTYKIPMIIVCRHHANEVSSTNASLRLIKELITNDKYADLQDRLKLVIVPIENVDGVQIHYELQKDNPTFKIHVARFNALGKEFAHEMFNLDTIHTEALAFRKLYVDNLFDVVIDDHGVPSHEWEQPYSGYVSPLFKGFWLPRSILYGYFWTVNEKQYTDNLKLCKAMEKAIAKGINDHEELVKQNQECIEKFEKYAFAWMPKLFPAPYAYNMITYWINRDENPTNLYVSQRFPWITTCYYTSEVADETAQGDYLYTCASTHFIHDLAIINLLNSSSMHYNLEYSCANGSISAKRIRPISIEEKEMEKIWNI